MVNDNTRKTPSADTTVVAYRPGDVRALLRLLLVAISSGAVIGLVAGLWLFLHQLGGG